VPPHFEVPLAGVGMQIDAGGAGDLLDLPAGHLRERVLEHKLLVLRGFRALARDELLAFARGFEPGGSRLLEWPTGPIMDVAIDENAVNYLFSREPVPLHWDGFFNVEPSYLIWQCAKAPRRGGATIFSDAAGAWDLADGERRRRWSATELTYTTERKAHYGGVASRSLVRPHPVTRRMTLRYAEPVATNLNPLSVTCAALPWPDLVALLHDLRSSLYDPRICHHHAWRDGDIVIADNHALLHGRTAVDVDGPRYLRRVQIL
jgi:alpha-ketoglutarate-dependent taurine dioxygenase